jgi:hypothetical protein
LLSGVILFYFQQTYKNKVIPGVFVGNTYIGELRREQIEKTFDEKNEKIAKNMIIFSAQGVDATASAKTLKIGYNTNLIADQALNLGKSKNLFSDVYLILSSYVNGTFLDSTYSYDDDAVKKAIDPIQKEVYKEPVDAQFSLNDNKRVATFKQSTDGKSVDYEKLGQEVNFQVKILVF